MLLYECINEVGEIDYCFIVYVFVFLIAFLYYLPLLLYISNRARILNLNVADTIGENNCND